MRRAAENYTSKAGSAWRRRSASNAEISKDENDEEVQIIVKKLKNVIKVRIKQEDNTSSSIVNKSNWVVAGKHIYSNIE